MDSTSNPSSGQQSSSSVRSKVDPTWGHVTQSRDANGKLILTCMHCFQSYKGGGINRLKQHLAGQKGQVVSCKKVPFEVRVELQQLLKDTADKKKEAQSAYQQMEDMETSMEDLTPPEATPVQNVKKRKTSEGIQKFFSPSAAAASQPCIKSVLAGKEAKLRVDMAVARLIYATNTPLNIVNSPHFKEAVDGITGFGRGYKAPSYHELRFGLLKNAKKECQLLIDTYRSNWVNSECTLMADSWNDIRSR